MKSKNIMQQIKFKPKVKSLISIVTFGVVILWAILANAGCKKTESPYYKYQNNTTNFNGSIYEFLQAQNGVFDSLLKVIDSVPGLKDSLSTETGLTFFAAPNNCFANALQNLNLNLAAYNLPPKYLSDIDTTPDMDTLVSRYLFNGLYPTDSLIKYGDAGVIVPSFRYAYGMNLAYQRNTATGFQNGGPQFINFTDLHNSLSASFWVTVPTISVNIKANNGIIHILTDTHSFGFNDFINRFSQVH
ncbi:hypothetical protein [Arachidicoccus soli]|uniref:FAS1 domain-containing protein n=1 Tax=Arachidicoccus soli TaxID=2341117 RepID=A0A386HRD1_9BACT|nr:hypothetical protein [Arachidicoccus soli]AYD48518.1 hypothetical protein D6B99_13445 [Arachidicoccus soli]